MIKLKELEDIQFSDVDNSAYADYSDAFVESATYKGREMTEEELNEINDDYRDFVYQKLIDWVF